jgi:uncharacterized membrane protein YuzA (DUF378 family)
MAKKDTLGLIAMVLLIIGGLNWLLAVWGINLVEFLSVGWLINLVYILVGLSAIYKIFTFNK